MDVGKLKTQRSSFPPPLIFAPSPPRNCRNAATSMPSMGFSVADLLRMRLECAAPPLWMPRAGVLRGCCVLSATPKVMPDFDFGGPLRRGGKFAGGKRISNCVTPGKCKLFLLVCTSEGVGNAFQCHVRCLALSFNGFHYFLKINFQVSGADINAQASFEMTYYVTEVTL